MYKYTHLHIYVYIYTYVVMGTYKNMHTRSTYMFSHVRSMLVCKRPIPHKMFGNEKYKEDKTWPCVP